MTKLFEDIKEGLEEAIAYSEGKDTGANTLIEEENKRIEEQNNPHFWLSVETDSRKVYAHKLIKNEMVKITYSQALEEYKNGTAFTKQALEKLGVTKTLTKEEAFARYGNVEMICLECSFMGMVTFIGGDRKTFKIVARLALDIDCTKILGIKRKLSVFWDECCFVEITTHGTIIYSFLVDYQKRKNHFTEFSPQALEKLGLNSYE